MKRRTSAAPHREPKLRDTAENEVTSSISPPSAQIFSNLDELDMTSTHLKTPSLTESSYSGLSEESLPLFGIDEESPSNSSDEKQELRVLIYAPCYNVIDG